MSAEVIAHRARHMLERALSEERQEFGSFFLSRFLGMQVSYDQDGCTVEFEVNTFMFNPQGSLHGGILATALDISMGHLLKHQIGAGATLEMKVQYFAPVRGGLVRCRATFLKKGRKTFFLQSYAYDSAGATMAHATSTWRLI